MFLLYTVSPIKRYLEFLSNKNEDGFILEVYAFMFKVKAC